MADYPALPIWTDAILADCSHLTEQQFGAYIHLLILIWRTPGCRIPADDAWLEHHFRGKPTMVQMLHEFCHCDGNWWTQKRLSKVRAEVAERYRKQSVRAKARWRKEKDASRGNAAPGSAVAMQTKTITILDSKEESRGAPRGGPEAPTPVRERAREAAAEPIAAEPKPAPELPVAPPPDQSLDPPFLAPLDEQPPINGAEAVPMIAGEEADPRFAALAGRLQAIIASPAPLSMARVHSWLKAGADPELDIIPTVSELCAARGAGGPPRSMAYFDRAIAEALESRKRSLEVPHGEPKLAQSPHPARRFGRSEPESAIAAGARIAARFRN